MIIYPFCDSEMTWNSDYTENDYDENFICSLYHCPKCESIVIQKIKVD